MAAAQITGAAQVRADTTIVRKLVLGDTVAQLETTRRVAVIAVPGWARSGLFRANPPVTWEAAN